VAFHVVPEDGGYRVALNARGRAQAELRVAPGANNDPVVVLPLSSIAFDQEAWCWDSATERIMAEAMATAGVSWGARERVRHLSALVKDLDAAWKQAGFTVPLRPRELRSVAQWANAIAQYVEKVAQ
jgi:hypothetical protein